jgi:hypothetical protein
VAHRGGHVARGCRHRAVGYGVLLGAVTAATGWNAPQRSAEMKMYKYPTNLRHPYPYPHIRVRIRIRVIC